MRNILFLLCIIIFFSCQASRSNDRKIDKLLDVTATHEIQSPSTNNITIKDTIIDDTTFVNIRDYSADFAFDMKYATADNFLKVKVYDCAECYLRLKTVKALINANTAFLKLGYRIQLFDCYRPLSVQKKMWSIVSDPNYVADPTKGSIHNRGGAVDITLIDNAGNILDMGTPFDYFGKKASHGFEALPDQIITNRQLLKKVMIENGFKPLLSEWWHYDLSGSAKDKLSDFKWECR